MFAGATMICDCAALSQAPLESATSSRWMGPAWEAFRRSRRLDAPATVCQPYRVGSALVANPRGGGDGGMRVVSYIGAGFPSAPHHGRLSLASKGMIAVLSCRRDRSRL